MTNSIQDFFRDNPWELIREPCYPEGRRLYLKDDRFWVSMDENREILFFIHEKGGQDVEPVKNLAGLTIFMEQFASGESRLICRLNSQDGELLEKFATVAKDIAFHCSGFKGPQLFTKAQERIRSWADFLRPSRTGLTHAEFVGFLGELHVLGEHLIPSLGASDSLRAWIGPDGKKQDFTFNDCAVELKTTVSGDQQSVRISSLDQLDKVTGDLFLGRIVASPAAEESGVSLGELYETCLDAMASDVLQETLFLQKASALYGKASEKQVSDRYQFTDVTLYEVSDDFPKLTQDNVHTGIRAAVYDISVGALSGHAVDTTIEAVLSNG